MLSSKEITIFFRNRDVVFNEVLKLRIFVVTWLWQIIDEDPSKYSMIKRSPRVNCGIGSAFNDWFANLTLGEFGFRFAPIYCIRQKLAE